MMTYAQAQASSTLRSLLCAQNKQLFAPLYKPQALSRGSQLLAPRTYMAYIKR